MPKTNIYESAPSIEEQRTRVSVGWAHERDVQIGVLHLRPDADRDREYGDDGELNWQGWWMDLTRPQVNHLIQELRKARDDAFGRDA
jgi:hypothetical protein